eukprot:9851241-Karenia_brevis.AAC.1
MREVHQNMFVAVCDVWANDGVTSLNQLAGTGSCLPGHRISFAQAKAIEGIKNSYFGIGSPTPDTPTCEGALRELLASSSIYTDDRHDVQSYAKGLVAWPPENSQPIDVLGALPEADRE